MKRLTVLSHAALFLLLAASLVSAKPTPTGTPAATTKPASSTMAAAPTKPAAAGAKAKPAAAAPASAMVDLNSASKADLMKLPGVGEAISAKIVAGRPWANKSQLLTKNVVNKPTYAKIAPLVIAKQGK